MLRSWFVLTNMRLNMSKVFETRPHIGQSFKHNGRDYKLASIALGIVIGLKAELVTATHYTHLITLKEAF